MIALIVVAAIILLLAVWFNIPYSPVKTQFKNDVAARTQKIAAVASDKYTADDFKDLPPTIQKYLELNGYIGAKRQNVLSMEYRDVNFGLGVNKPRLRHTITTWMARAACRASSRNSLLYSTRLAPKWTRHVSSPTLPKHSSCRKRS